MSDLVSIVLPVYNQADHVGPIVDGYQDALEKVHYPHEMLLVVNGCRDNSLEVCTALEEKYPSVRVIASDPGGWGLAVKLGLEAAQGGTLCYTNSARTSPEDLVLMVLYAIANPTSVVKAHRRSRESFTRRLGSFLYNLECRVLFDLPTWDLNSTPKAFSRGVYDEIVLTSDGDLIDLEFFAECQRVGAHVLEVPIYSKARHGGESTTNYKTAFNLYTGALRLYRARNRA